MTREEAIKKADEAWDSGQLNTSYGESVVKVLAALGMLKLDEPKSAEEKFCDAYHGVGCFVSMGPLIKKTLDAAGVKIVEK